jgi:SAM-dependent methyltransferase
MDEPIPEGFEIVSCPSCGSDRFKPALTGKDWILDPKRDIHIVRCEKCGFNFTNPRPKADHLGAYYSAEYTPYKKQRGEIHRKSAASTSLRTWVLCQAYGSPNRKPKGWRKIVAQAVMLVQPLEQFGFGVPYQGSGRLLDFGCGNGTFLRRMQAVGWNCTGLDFSDQAVEAVKADGIPAFLGSLPHPEIKSGSFDLVTMRQALEHVPNPREILQAALDVLRPGGMLVIAVPNFDSWEIEYFGDASLTLELPRHLNHFTAPTLRQILDSVGFKSIDIRQSTRTSWLAKSVKQLNRRQKKKWDGWLRFKPALHVAAIQSRLRAKGNQLMATARKPR